MDVERDMSNVKVKDGSHSVKDKTAQASHPPRDITLLDNSIPEPDRELGRQACTHFSFLLFSLKEKRLLQAPPKVRRDVIQNDTNTQACFFIDGATTLSCTAGFSIGFYLLILALISISSLNLYVSVSF